MKSEEEIQKAHDMIIEALEGKIAIGRMSPQTAQIMAAQCDVLCWVLGHDHNDTFDENLTKLKKRFEALGYSQQKSPDP